MKKAGIFPKLLFTMLMIATIPLAFNWLINYQSSLERLTDQVEQRLAAQAEGLVDYVDNWTEMNIKMLRQNALLDDIISMDAAKQIPVLKLMTRGYEWVNTSYTIAPDAQGIARSDTEPPKKYPDRNYFQEAIKGNIGKELVISKTYARPTNIIAVPVYNSDKKIVGVLATSSSVVNVSDVITNIRIGKTGYAFLVDEKGRVVAHFKKAYTQTISDLSQHPIVVALGKEEKKQLIFDDIDTKKKTYAFAHRAKHGWIVVVQQDYSEAFAPVTEANINALIVLGVTLFVVIIVAFWFARRLSRPILNMARVADNVSRGELSTKINETSRSDEIGDLARAIDRLGTSMKLAIARLGKR